MAKGPSINTLAFAYLSSRSDKDFKNLHDRLRPGLYSYCMKIVKDSETCDDIISDGFSKIWRKIDTYDPRWSFSTWCYRIVHNETMQHIRDSKKNPSGRNAYSLTSGDTGFSEALMREAEALIEDSYDFTEFDTKVVSVEEMHESVMRAIDMLPDHYKKIMYDREVHKMKYADIAKKYGLQINTVKTRIVRAREKVCDGLNINRKRASA